MAYGGKGIKRLIWGIIIFCSGQLFIQLLLQSAASSQTRTLLDVVIINSSYAKGNLIERNIVETI